MDDNLKCLSFMGYDVEPEDDYLESSKVFFFNDDMQIGMACPSKSMEIIFLKF
jgi:homogentisate 1,2-dioxygenase